MEAWGRKMAQRFRTAKARAEKLKKRLAKTKGPDERKRLEALVTEALSQMSQAVERSAERVSQTMWNGLRSASTRPPQSLSQTMKRAPKRTPQSLSQTLSQVPRDRDREILPYLLRNLRFLSRRRRAIRRATTRLRSTGRRRSRRCWTGFETRRRRFSGCRSAGNTPTTERPSPPGSTPRSRRASRRARSKRPSAGRLWRSSSGFPSAPAWDAPDPCGR